MVFTTPVLTLAYDLNEKLLLEGTLTGVYQYGDFDIEGIKDTGRGAAVLDLRVNFHPTERDEFQITLSYAAGNGLNAVVPFSLAPYADDLEDDLKNINGRNRDYLLEAWYKHKFIFTKDISLGVTLGIIDSTAYIDDNTFANDEVAQFMNDIFVNNTLANLPSYDLGAVAELDISNFSIRGLIMTSKTGYETTEVIGRYWCEGKKEWHDVIADVEKYKEYDYYALQLGYKLETLMGEGNYRIYGFTTNKRFPKWDGAGDERLQGLGFSADQKLSEIIGVFARFGWQDDKAAAVVHDAVYSGGLNISGNLWGRKNDVIGLGYAYLNGADKAEIDNTNVIEAYAKFKITEFSDVTFDVQYIKDDMRHNEDRDGVIYGVRLNAYF